MKGYISLTNLVRMLNKAVELDPRQVQEIAKACGFEERTFRSIRKFNPRKPLQYLSERIRILNELTTEIVFEELPRVEVDGPRLELWNLLGLLDNIPSEYRGYKLRLNDDGVFQSFQGLKTNEVEVESDIEGEPFDNIDEALDDIKARIDEAIDAPEVYEGFLISYTEHVIDHNRRLYTADAFLPYKTEPRKTSKREDVDRYLGMVMRGEGVSVRLKSDNPHKTKAEAFRFVKSEIDSYLLL